MNTICFDSLKITICAPLAFVHLRWYHSMLIVFTHMPFTSLPSFQASCIWLISKVITCFLTLIRLTGSSYLHIFLRGLLGSIVLRMKTVHEVYVYSWSKSAKFETLHIIISQALYICEIWYIVRTCPRWNTRWLTLLLNVTLTGLLQPGTLSNWLCQVLLMNTLEK